MTYTILNDGHSRSFPDGDAFLANASQNAEVMIYLGGAGLQSDDEKAAILVELGTECLGVHTGEGGTDTTGEEGSNILGFSRYRNGEDEPSDLIELVRQPRSSQAAIDAVKALFEAAGFQVAVCSDQTGRIIDRLVRPKYNAALRFLDEGLASAKDMDLTCRMGLGYPDGPIERVCRGGLDHHYDVTQALFETNRTPGYAPARRAVVAKQRQEQ
jgi:3-hydroxybutyryl-CoA dehydrogenase